MKKIIAGIIIGAIATTSISAVASSSKKTLDAYYTVNKLIVNGVDTGKGNTAFINNGTTYVPLKTISDALGHTISWDQQTRNIYINSNVTTNTGGNPTDLPLANQFTSKIISVEEAGNIAIKQIGGGKIIQTKSDLYDSDKLPHYEFKILYGNRMYEVEVNAITGAIMDFEID